MSIIKKARSWAIDYVYMARGNALMTIHKNPPKHYLGYVVAGKAPVILIPGITTKWGFMKRLGDRISLAGHPVYVVPKLQYNIFNIPMSAQKVWNVICDITQQTGHTSSNTQEISDKIRVLTETHGIAGAVLVTHSKGGLIGKYLLIHHNHSRQVKGLVAIAAPFSGSRIAHLIPHNAFKELRTDSEIIRELSGHTTVNRRIISIMPEFDNHVLEGSYLNEALDNIIVPIHGHHKILFNSDVQNKVLESVERLSSL